MRIVVQELAEHDLLEASLWYESKVPALGKHFLQEVDQALLKLSKDPTIYSFYYSTQGSVPLFGQFGAIAAINRYGTKLSE